MRALLIPSGVGRSHLTRLLLVARALRRHGADVAFAFRPHELLHDIDVFPVPELETTDFSRNVFSAYSPDLVEACVDAEVAAVEEFRPDVVISDLRPSAAISTKVARVPHVAIVNAYLARGFDPGVVLARGRSMARTVQYVQKRTSVGAFRLVARKRGLGSLRSLDDFLEGDRTLLCDLPEFCPVPGGRFVGPLVWEDGPDSGDRPSLYVTTGNTGGRRLVDLVLEAFGGDESRPVLVTTGAYLDVSDVEPPPHIRVQPFASGAAGRADVVVHCGGNGTTYQVLGQGRPAVVMPFTNDQRINAALVERQRVGTALDPARTCADDLVAAVANVHRNTDSGALQRFRRLVTGSDGAERVAAHVLECSADRRR